ncbi:hypothetical protein EYF80_039124 [Liparis tanakae]|uniref:Uncharacterized protein n=1 Tax=Liparis tanakae TaxID=230148 RepID=A0A4Z2GD82_9TELE|nr:hypothetical protein EYF80_039124 [Liparis tanakae]
MSRSHRGEIKRSLEFCCEAQHGPFSEPARSDLVGLVLSSMSVKPVAVIRIGIFSSVSGESKSI